MTQNNPDDNTAKDNSVHSPLFGYVKDLSLAPDDAFRDDDDDESDYESPFGGW